MHNILCKHKLLHHLLKSNKMRTVIISLVFIASASITLANEKIYKKLNSLYTSNPEMCLEKAKKYIDKKPSEAAPYYFASSIYLDKTSQSQTVRGKYLQLRRAINYAHKFEKYADDDFREKVNWSERVMELQTNTTKIVHALDKTNQSDLAQELIENINKLESISDLKAEIIPNEIIIDTKIAPEKTTFVKLENQFYGLPNGTEIVASASTESEQELLKIINNARLKKNMPPLTWNEDLVKASRYHAYDLGTQAYFDHKSCDRIDGELIEVGAPFERVKKFYTSTYVNSENIAAGSALASGTYNQWLNSQGHSENMFKTESKYAGIGVCYIPESPFGYYWVMVTAE